MAASRRRRRSGDHDEEHDEGRERWLVTYADMVTLLMVLFIIMFAMSTVDEKKYHDLRTGLADGFGRSVTILNGADPVLDDQGATEAGDHQLLVQELSGAERETATQVLAAEERLRTQRAYAEAREEVQRLLRIWRRIEDALRRNGLRGDVRAQVDERGLVVSLVSQHVVFEPNVAELTERGRRVVDTVAPVLAGLAEPIEVDGHTNQVPVRPKYYPTDWELSAARAVHVLRRLEEVGGLPTARLRATGFGHTAPLVDPEQPGSQRVNKRVDIVVLSQAPAETRARLPEIYDALAAPALHRGAAGADAPGTGPLVSSAASTVPEEEQP